VNIPPEAIAAAQRKLWREGKLKFKLHATQSRIYEAILASGKRRHFLLCSRRLGKSYMLLCLVMEQCLRKSGSRCLFLAPTAKDAADIGNDLANQIIQDCPDEVKPEYKAQAKELHFKNGSIVRFKGVNAEHAESIRGGAADLVILDECGIMDDLMYVLQSVVAPMTLTTKGRIYLATTPPKSPGHESAELHEKMAAQGLVSTYTLRDAPHIEYAEKVQILQDCGEKEDRIRGILDGTLEPETTTAQREYFCNFVTDANSAVIPEFDAQARKDIVVEWETPPYRDCYTVMDPGFVDATGCLFAYWDFLKARLVIEDELVMVHANSSQIAEAVRAKEEALWPHKPPFLRISDIDKRLIADLSQLYGIGFSPANKRDSDSAIHLMRTMVSGRQLVINPRCTGLVRQMKNAIFNTKATDFAQGDKIDRHFDLVAALKYLCRGVIQTRNPYPEWFHAAPPGHYTSPKGRKQKDKGLLADTPLGRRLLKGKKKK
jgi:hypothetical protein